MSLWFCIALGIGCSLGSAYFTAWFTINWTIERAVEQDEKLSEAQTELSKSNAIQAALIQILWRESGLAVEAIDVTTSETGSEAHVKMLKVGKEAGMRN